MAECLHRAGDFQKFQNWVIQKTGELLGNESLAFLEWCLAKLEVNYRLHQRKCHKPLDCDVNKSYERRLSFVRNLITQSKPGFETEETISEIPMASFQLSENKGDKIDFIRVVNALYEKGFFQSRTGARLSKVAVMKTFGQLLGTDLSEYDKDLSQSFKSMLREEF